jgi:hypothetical protein
MFDNDFEDDFLEEEEDDFLSDYSPEAYGYKTSDEYLEHIFKD